MSIPSKCGGVLVKWLARQTFDLKVVVQKLLLAVVVDS